MLPPVQLISRGICSELPSFCFTVSRMTCTFQPGLAIGRAMRGSGAKLGGRSSSGKQPFNLIKCGQSGVETDKIGVRIHKGRLSMLTRTPLTRPRELRCWNP